MSTFVVLYCIYLVNAGRTGAPPPTHTPVSYTHLDVYKRQVINSNEFTDSFIAASELTEDVIAFVNSAKLWTESFIVDLT